MSHHTQPLNTIFKLSSKPRIERRRKYGIGRNKEKKKYSINKIKHTVSEEVNLPWIGLYSHPIPDTPDFGILRSKLRSGTLKMCVGPESPSLPDRVMGEEMPFCENRREWVLATPTYLLFHLLPWDEAVMSQTTSAHQKWLHLGCAITGHIGTETAPSPLSNMGGWTIPFLGHPVQMALFLWIFSGISE